MYHLHVSVDVTAVIHRGDSKWFKTLMYHLHVSVDVTAVIHRGYSKWFKASADTTDVDAIGGGCAVKSCCVVPLHSGKHPTFT